MRRIQWLAVLAATFALSTSGWGRQSGQTQAATPPQAAPLPPQTDSLADAARRARERQKLDPKTTTKVFTNENIPSTNGISIVGSTSDSLAAGSTDDGSKKASGTSDKDMWRARFAKLNHQLEQDQAMLDVMQRELGVMITQFYNGDPVKAMQQGLSQSDVTDKTAKIDAKKKDIEADKQAISDAEAELQKAGGDPGWER